MTGFGAAEGSVSGGRLQIEIRSVNHRHFNLQLKVPAELLPLEAEVRERLRARVARGHVTVAARWTEEPVRAGALRLNLARARELVDAVRELQRTLDLPGDVDVGWIVRQPDVLGAEPTAEPALDAAQVLGILDRAADALQAMRDTEGASLVRELSGHLAALEVELGQVERRAPDRLVAERDRLRQAVATLLDGGRLDESRLARRRGPPARVSRSGDAARDQHHRLQGERCGHHPGRDPDERRAGEVPRASGEPGVTPFLLVLSSPSGAGKTTITKALLAARDDLGFSISATTRPPRSGEVDGVDYHFLTPGEFERRRAAGAFLEWAEYGGQRYGTLVSEVERVLAQGRHVILDIEVQGARQLRERRP
ncbi:MAG: hypothetical protein HYY94_03435, partial [Gemmatimonadetes bacterium]|nr:hypothetical protein [Gemmatimonadota bacterium]